jgi:anti-sigma factor RsiW
MNKARISSFLLERYRIGEVTAEEKKYVEDILAKDEQAASALANLDNADNDFKRRFPLEKFFPSEQKESINSGLQRMSVPRFGSSGLRKVPALVWSICAAALVVIVALPLIILKNPRQAEFGDRIKGASTENSSIELSVYIKEKSSGEGVKLTNQANVREGNTVQLAYQVSGGASAEKYGIIFSIDGRSSVTMHFPYAPWQSTLLESGKPVPLDEAYTLDDAPDYEIFFFVTGEKPLDVGKVMDTAKQLAARIEKNPGSVESYGIAAFNKNELAMFTLIKE